MKSMKQCNKTMEHPLTLLKKKKKVFHTMSANYINIRGSIRYELKGKKKGKKKKKKKKDKRESLFVKGTKTFVQRLISTN